ncbi:MAG: [FeFe] hydrogenase H-cluster radical SAM maturase HydE [Wolinella sp.]
MSLVLKIMAKQQASLEELVKVLADSSYDETLFKCAHEVRLRYARPSIHLKALLELSNICVKTCSYCGLRAGNRHLKRYKIPLQEAINLAQKAINSGYQTLVLQSSESHAYDRDELCELISAIHHHGARVTLSLGEKSFEEYQAYKESGANRYLLRIETTNSQLYATLHPNMSHQNRFTCLENLQKLGFETGSGSLVGLPGQSLESIAEDLLFFQESDFDMVGIGPFIPAPHTPLEHARGGDFHTSRKVMALLRLLMPYINIPATSAMEALHPEGRFLALQSGANVIMPAITEGEMRTLYQLYPGKGSIQDESQDSYAKLTNQITHLGESISLENGDSQRFILRNRYASNA